MGKDTQDEFFEDLAIECACCRGLWVELATDNEPVFQATFDTLDHPILAFCSNFEGICKAIDGHMMSAGDSDFTFSIDTTKDRFGIDDQGVAVVGVLGICMREGIG